MAKRPPQCLEYIMVHELMHSQERCHNKRFTALMDGFMTRWHLYRDMLNEIPLGHAVWVSVSAAGSCIAQPRQ